MKNVLLWCFMGVCVDKRINQNFICLLIDIYDFFFGTWSMKNSVKIQIQATRCQHFGSNQLGGKCKIYMHI
jgi:hypothetical protein